MPRFYYADDSSSIVNQCEYERLQDMEEEAWYEVFALAKWLAWNEWVAEFGENNEDFPFNPNSMEVFKEAQRLMGD